MKQTAVEWLINQLGKSGFDFSSHQGTIQQAKEMEKHQTDDAYNKGYYKGFRDDFEKELKELKNK